MVGAELLGTGQLSEAISRVAGEVRARPTDPAARTFYFELLSLSGDLDRAAKQLEVLETASGEIGTGTAIYLGAIQAEKERRQFFHGGPRPQLFVKPRYAEAYLQAVENYAAGETVTSRGILEEADGDWQVLRGSLNGKEIHELSESHDLLGPFLEVVMDGHYTWVPWESIRSLAIPEPRYLRDTVWTPASISLQSAGSGEVLVFSLYVDSHLHPDDVKLGRRTVWETNPEGITVAYGQKIITADEQDYPILGVRALEVEACPLAA